MKSRFFDRNKAELQFEWNAARNTDWVIIRRNFVAAYISAYINRSFADLQYDEQAKQHAEDIWNAAFNKGYESLFTEIIQPLQVYFAHEQYPLEYECSALKRYFLDTSQDIALVKEKIVKLILLQHHFEHDFQEEILKIQSGTKKIDYLILRFHDQPIAFFVCELNYKSAHTYLRFVTMAPAFHRLGLGNMILDKVANRYPDSTGMELYTRKANYSVRAFYKHYGFTAFEQFAFNEPVLSSESKSRLFFPSDDGVNNTAPFIAFHKSLKSYR